MKNLRVLGRSISVIAGICLVVSVGVLSAGPNQAAAAPGTSPSIVQRSTCLVGVWHVTDYISYMEAIFPKNELQFQGVTGLQGIKYERNGDAVDVANHFTIHAVDTQTHLAWATELTGATYAVWRTPSKGVVRYSHIDGEYTETITVGDHSSSHPSTGLISAGSQHFTCTKTTLRIFPHPSLPPIVLTRHTS